MADAPGDVMSSECQEVDKGTLDKISMWGANSRLEVKVHYEPSCSVIFAEGVFAVELCPPGLMCRLDCPWLNPYLFVSLGGWFVISREQLVFADLRRYCWEPGGTHSMVGFQQECAPVVCRDFTPKDRRLDQSFVRSSEPV